MFLFLWHPTTTSFNFPRNWQAFDDEGMACLVECCPGLEVLLLDRAEPLEAKRMSSLGFMNPQEHSHALVV